MNKYFDINTSRHSIRSKLYYDDIHNINKVIHFGHGLGGHKDNKAAQRFAEWVLSKNKGIATLIITWPCHGDDVKKKLILSDCETYINLAIEHAKKVLETDEIYVYATNFGGYLFLKYIHG